MTNIKKILHKNSVFYISSVISFLFLTAIVFLFPLELSEYRTTDRLAPFWYLITETGGFYGSCIIIIILFSYLIFKSNKYKWKRSDLIFIIVVILTAQIFTIITSQLYVKNVFHKERPSQLYFEEKGFIEKGGKEFFAMPLEEKRKYLRSETDSSIKGLTDIYPPILDSWINNSEFSFPSGHAQSSFFLGTAIAFIIFMSSGNKYLFLLPLIWAVLVSISRVVIGVHYPIDVTIGALSGLITALFIVSLNKINTILDLKNKKKYE